MKQIVLAMTESDAHVVGNKLLEIFLNESGFNVNNRGACTPLEEVFQAASKEATLAIVLGSQNGHALEDISELNNLRVKYGCDSPVIMGGNLSVGANKSDDLADKISASGVDYIISEFDELIKALDKIENYISVSDISRELAHV